MHSLLSILTLALFCYLSSANDASCTNYCTLIFSTAYGAACSTDFGPTQSACMYWCQQYQFPLGNFNLTSKLGDTSTNTIGCRLTAGYAAIADGKAKDASSYCKSSSITGGNVCGAYCDTYCLIEKEGNCSETYAVNGLGYYDNACQVSCAAFPVGLVDSGISAESNWANNVQCRLYHAGTPAALVGLFHCNHATPHGGGVCGTDICEGYCQQLKASCNAYLPEILSDFNECNTSCNLFLGQKGTSYTSLRAFVGNLTTPAYGQPFDGDTIACRTYHASAPAISVSASTHCPHATPSGGGVCDTGTDQCLPYCDLATTACTGKNAVYTDYSACTTACASYSIAGLPNATTGNTLYSRINNLLAALTDPSNCPAPSSPPTAPTAPSSASSLDIVVSVVMVCSFALLL